MSPEELRASLEQLDVALVRAGAEQPTSLLPAPTLDEFADAEQRLGLSLPETIREWYRWRNGVPRAGNSWMQTMLIDYWEHLPLSQVDELLDMLNEVIEDEEIPADLLDGLLPILATDNRYLFVDVRTDDLKCFEMDLFTLTPFLADDSGLLAVIDSFVEQLEASS